ncbi:hypothetical protein [Roseibium litorale]|uniref:Uncharacterized protein n=1 Tax=Roseibium litorale TaxID=2803841 RepID=A0ABR9CK98_9HYPH|nr:hypothetical protein [Roseibium litorale]MBD8890757.1 hypothetical protein [Roseibium litorale]
MRQVLAFSVCSVLLFAEAFAQNAFDADEFSMISRDRQGTFLGSHKIFKRPSKGLKKVSYCQQEYWIRPYTVAWAQTEVENKRIVRVEYSVGRGWRPICANPQTQVTLADFGINQDASEVIYFGGIRVPTQGETIFGAMKRSFAPPKADEKATGSYHAK